LHDATTRRERCVNPHDLVANPREHERRRNAQPRRSPRIEELQDVFHLAQPRDTTGELYAVSQFLSGGSCLKQHEVFGAFGGRAMDEHAVQVASPRQSMRIQNDPVVQLGRRSTRIAQTKSDPYSACAIHQLDLIAGPLRQGNLCWPQCGMSRGYLGNGMNAGVSAKGDNGIVPCRERGTGKERCDALYWSGVAPAFIRACRVAARRLPQTRKQPDQEHESSKLPHSAS
jgi:hypothetical protein